ncbi:DUF167 domain-containing protein [Dictyobacter arantiisoli]|uniref:UPF0235 protein KDI_32460 n=1 Tax=Dictyobacter arantiisoli TaxID=2014874 RepID=A0A5A5TE35_9CHLR|nr:DUF167 domain-containing protein [Dictyobacter arantiisoli]GCF09682.1 UPF0235 protein [Dictyobacter arantiisoli]
MLLSVRVIPRSGRNKLEWDGTKIKARLTAPPVDGAANEALIALLAQQLALPKRSITIVRGATSRHKTVAIEQLTSEELKRLLQ